MVLPLVADCPACGRGRGGARPWVCATSRRPGFCTTPNSTGPVACGRTSMPRSPATPRAKAHLAHDAACRPPQPTGLSCRKDDSMHWRGVGMRPHVQAKGRLHAPGVTVARSLPAHADLPAPGALLLQEGLGAGEVALAQAIMRPSPTRPRTVFRPEGRVFAWPLMSTRSHVPSPLPSGIDFSLNSPTERQITDLPEAACVLSALVRRGCLGVYGIGIATPVRRIVNASRG